MNNTVESALRRIREESTEVRRETMLTIKNLSKEQLEELIDSLETEILQSHARIRAIEDEKTERGILD